MSGKRRMICKPVALVLIAALLCPCALFAAENKESEETTLGASEIQKKYPQQLESLITEQTQEGEELPLKADTYFRYMPSRKVSAMPGKVGIMESANECTYTFKAFDKLPLEFSFQTEYISINNSTEVKLPSHLTSLIAGLQATLPVFSLEKTYFRLALYPSYRGENWEVRPSSFRMPVLTYFIYQPSDKWTFVAGVGTYPDYRTKVVPIVGFIYAPNDKWLFNIVPVNPNINYKLNDKLTFFAEAGMMGDEYEVEKDGRKNVVLEYDSYRGGAGIAYKFNKYVESSVSVGGVFGRRLQYRDSLGKVNIDSGMYSEFRVDVAV